MANKDLIINSDFDILTKTYALILCVAGDLESATNKILSEFNISKLQLDILHELHLAQEDVLSIKEIKEKMVSDSPNVSRSVNKLMENGFIEKERTLADQRVVKVKITKKGKEIHENADKARLKVAYQNNLSESEVKALYDLLSKM